jgi:DHA1 family inner membrane transport protein
MPSSSTTSSTTSSALPFVVLLLTLGTFLMSTTEFVIAGLLPEMASDFGVSLPRAGLLITAFAVGMIVGAPAMALATLRLPRRATLVLALVVFAAGHVIAALDSSFLVVIAARMLTALATGAFWSVAAVVATTAAGAAASSRALGVMMSGVGLATVVGVPLGSWVGQQIGWRGAFWALAVLAAVAALVIARFVPSDEHRDVPSVRTELAALSSARLWLLLAATVFVTGAYMATFSYISPLLTERAGIPAAAVPLVLVGFGIGSLVGTNTGGRFADRRPVATFLTAAIAVGLVLALLIPFSSTAATAVLLVLLLGVAGMAVPPVATGLAVRFAHSAPTLAAALAVAAFNTGIAVGSWAAGAALASPLGTTGPALVGVGMVVVGLVPLLALAMTRATRTGSATTHTPDVRNSAV